MSSATLSAIDYARSLGEEGFWGFLTLKFENGHVVHVRREENLKPKELGQRMPEKDRTLNHEYINKCI